MLKIRNKEINTYLALFANLGIVMILYSLCRVFFYIFNLALFPDISVSRFLYMLWGGLRFDLSAVSVINSVYIIFVFLSFKLKYKSVVQKILKYFFVITNSIGLMLNCIDIIYFRFTLRRTNASFFSEFKNEGSLISLVFDMIIDYWYIVIIWILLVFMLSLFYFKMKPIKVQGLKNNIYYYLLNVIAFAIIGFLWVIAVRGDYRKFSRPITLSNAGNYVQNPLEVGIVQNTPFSIIKTIGKKIPQRITFFSEGELKSVYNPYHQPKNEKDFQPKNVVIIIWESFSREFVGSLNTHLDNGNYKGYTPFIDTLLQYSTTFERSYANGRKSIDGLPSVTASIPFLNEPFVLSPFSGNFIKGIAGYLKEKNYHTSFFHGAHQGSMGFWGFLHTSGFDYSYAEEDYLKKYKQSRGGWGVWDEEMLQYMATELSDIEGPFCSVIFTLTSHHPYVLPDKYKNVFEEGPSPLYKCIRYTDYSIGRFFETASKQPWFNNTIFVITADHANDLHYPQNRNSVGQMSVPVIFFDPSDSIQKIYPYVAQQTDIMPTLLRMLNYDKPFIAFGQDALDSTINHIAINNLSGIYHVYYQQYAFICDEALNIVGLYDLDQDPYLRNNLEDKNPNIVNFLMDHLKGFIQQYNNRMIDNCLTVECIGDAPND